jgi:Protein tyrosine and serine/threonine kinase
VLAISFEVIQSISANNPGSAECLIWYTREVIKASDIRPKPKIRTLEKTRVYFLPEAGSSNDAREHPATIRPQEIYDEQIGDFRRVRILGVGQQSLETMPSDELESRWILNMVQHFKDDTSQRKFFVSFIEAPNCWRRVTISVDAGNTQPGSLEEALRTTTLLRDQAALIYDYIKDNLYGIKFFDTVTNLRLQIDDNKPHVYATEDVGETINYPPVGDVAHLVCPRYAENEVHFLAHLAGFNYKVTVNGKILVRKDMTEPNSVKEFIMGLESLKTLTSSSFVELHGIVVSNAGDTMKGILVEYVVKGGLANFLYINGRTISWMRRERWAKQIVNCLAYLHHRGLVKGRITLSDIGIDGNDNARILTGVNSKPHWLKHWKPPEIAGLRQGDGRTSALHCTTQSDVYQLGMNLWALGTQDPDPELQPRSLFFTPAQEAEIPSWYRNLVLSCLAEDPGSRPSASELLGQFHQ